jgi:hypothetical protein
MAENVTLEFPGRQFERLFAELAEMRSEQVSVREDMHVLTSIVLRYDATLNGILEQLHAMTAQLNRLDIRLRRQEEQRAPT